MNADFDNSMDRMAEANGFRYAAQAAVRHAAHALNKAATYYATQLGDRDLACDYWNNAVTLDPKNPMFRNNLACVLAQLGRLPEALIHSKKSVEYCLTPDEACFFTLGRLQTLLGDYASAAECFEKALQINPNCGMTHCQLGNLYLALGRFEEGLAHDEWRFDAVASLKRFRRRFAGPDWDGKALLEGKTVVLYNEQGLGDAIQYVRYVPRLKALGCSLIAEVQKELVTVFANTGWFKEVHASDLNQPSRVPPHDFALSIGSLPYWFDPALENTPNKVPYLKAEGTKVRDKISAFGDCFKVGLIWAGSQWHKDDRNRSCYLKHFKPLAAIPRVKLFSLQKGDMNRTWAEGQDNCQVVNLTDGAALDRVDLSEGLNDYNDAGDALEGLDLLVSVDTGPLHLAGALGRPAWLILPRSHEWRWQKSWYPTVRVWKQPAPGDWPGVISQITKELAALANGR